MQTSTEDILGYKVISQTRDSCISLICRWISSGERGKVLMCANPHSVVGAASDVRFHRALCEADVIIPDGVGIVLASRLFGGKIRQRLTGSDIFLGLSDSLNEEGGKSYFFLGSSEATLHAIRRNMEVDYPGIRFAGSYSPPFESTFTDADNRAMIEAVNACHPDVLWVGFDSAKAREVDLVREIRARCEVHRRHRRGLRLLFR